MAQTEIILGIDPGLNHTGWGVVLRDGARLSYVASGTLHTKPATSTAERLCELHNGLQVVVDTYKPQFVAVEAVYVNQNARTSLVLGQARGIALLVPALAGLPVAEYTPSEIKKAIVGTGKAEKDQVGYMVKALLPLAKPDTADAADALGVALCHAHIRQSPISAIPKAPKRQKGRAGWEAMLAGRLKTV